LVIKNRKGKKIVFFLNNDTLTGSIGFMKKNVDSFFGTPVSFNNTCCFYHQCTKQHARPSRTLLIAAFTVKHRSLPIKEYTTRRHEKNRDWHISCFQ
jgi:hypothetical protein